MIRGKNPKINWVEWSEKDMKGTYLPTPERDYVPEKTSRNN